MPLGASRFVDVWALVMHIGYTAPTTVVLSIWNSIFIRSSHHLCRCRHWCSSEMQVCIVSTRLAGGEGR